MILGENSKKKQREKLGKNGPFRYIEGHPRRGEVLHRSEGLPRCDEAEGPEKTPLMFAKT